MKPKPEDIAYVDLPHVSEIFVDSLGKFSFDGLIQRMELCVTRLESSNLPPPLKAKKYPAARLVMSRDTLLELHNHLSNLIAAMEKQGMIKRAQQPTSN